MILTILAFTLSIIICCVIAYILGLLWFSDIRNRRLRSFFLLGIEVFLWTLLNAISMLSPSGDYFHFIFTARLMFVYIIPFGITWFILDYTKSPLFGKTWVKYTLISLATIDVIMILLNPLHSLYYTDYIPTPLTGTIAFGIRTVFLVISFTLLIRYIIKGSKKNPLLILTGVGLLIPYVLNFLFSFGLKPFPHDLTPIGFFVTFLLFVYVAQRSQLFDISQHNLSNKYELMKYRLTSDALGIILWDMDYITADPLSSATEFTWSQEFRDMLGYSDENDFPNLLRSWSDLLHPEDKARVLDALVAHLNDYTGQTPYNIEYRLKMKTGDYRYFHAFGTTLRNNEGIPLRMAGATLDIDEKKKTQEALSQALFESRRILENMLVIFNKSITMIYITDIDTHEILFINDPMKEQFGIKGNVIGQPCYKVLNEGIDKRCDWCPCHRLDKEPDKEVIWEEHNTKTKRYYRNLDRYVDWPDGRKVHIQYSLDITDIIVAQQELSEKENEITFLEKEAEKIFIDPLTGIYNRRYLEDILKHLLKSLSRSGGLLSLMMIDIDNFKKYNDTYGHSEGDKCLKTVATTLSESIPRADDFVARYGGEEFTIVLPNTDENGARLMADKLLERIRSKNIPHESSDITSYVTFSIGVATGRVEHSQSGEDYIKMADEMLYQSKQSGRNRYSHKNIT